ncbi:hypothetical protein HPB58_20235 [Priestia filamentosa]|uniref:hypothetical protein n=1 Tax=Priestia filamentosa TaxID=1402861 RepID=UPI001FB40B66|nr:hypothetical protein [Priestia filamentosa]UOE59628.1 hypothetical protein HPB58_20235 [Priestia filamentosa]
MNKKWVRKSELLGLLDQAIVGLDETEKELGRRVSEKAKEQPTASEEMLSSIKASLLEIEKAVDELKYVKKSEYRIAIAESI